jgi:hypothetical protein
MGKNAKKVKNRGFGTGSVVKVMGEVSHMRLFRDFLT